jgi:anthranilate phosphoribosyltransferase
MDMREAIRAVVAGRDLTQAEMDGAMRAIMSGAATPAQIGGFLVALRMKGETVGELTAAARVMREFAVRVAAHGPHLIDTCGTGGDGANTFNISTSAAFVAAAAGARVAKHGNRSLSSRCGSADVLEAAGVRIDLSPAAVAECIDRVGIGFMFAPAHHGATRHAAGPRRELGVRTLFNALGPLTNPAGARNQIVGIFENSWVERVAHALRELGAEHVMVFHSDDGLDEISIGASTFVAELKGGEIRTHTLDAELFGIPRHSASVLAVSGVDEALARMREALADTPGPARDIVCLNAGAAIYVAGLEANLAAGVERARAVLRSGAAAAKLAALVELSKQLAGSDADTARAAGAPGNVRSVP